MKRRAELVIIAGPNGAGKSRLSPYYIHSHSFDGDLIAMNLRKSHPDWPDRWIVGTVAGELEKQKRDAIENQKDFAFETNFSNDLVINLINEFKTAGYKISLFYFGLNTITESLLRVDQRVLLGGHNVNNDVVEYNFKEGIKRMQSNLTIGMGRETHGVFLQLGRDPL